jgi:hypothetical protein
VCRPSHFVRLPAAHLPAGYARGAARREAAVRSYFFTSGTEPFVVPPSDVVKL